MEPGLSPWLRRDAIGQIVAVELPSMEPGLSPWLRPIRSNGDTASVSPSMEPGLSPWLRQKARQSLWTSDNLQWSQGFHPGCDESHVDGTLLPFPSMEPGLSPWLRRP